MHAPQFPCFASMAAYGASPLPDVAATLLWVSFAQRLAEPWPVVTSGTVEEAVMSSIPGLRTGFVTVSPDIAAARQITREALQLLELNALVMARHDADGQTAYLLTRRGRAALQTGDIVGAMTVIR